MVAGNAEQPNLFEEFDDVQARAQSMLCDSGEFLLELERRGKVVSSFVAEDGASVRINPYYMNNSDEGMNVGLWKIKAGDMTAVLEMLPGQKRDGPPMYFQATVDKDPTSKNHIASATDEDMEKIATYVSEAHRRSREEQSQQSIPAKVSRNAKKIAGIFRRRRHEP